MGFGEVGGINTMVVAGGIAPAIPGSVASDFMRNGALLKLRFLRGNRARVREVTVSLAARSHQEAA
jgi:hypothetical protein